MYPGNNTPEGFFSYYQYILGQREADKIICIKGGPGVGNSTFMKKIGEAMLEEGHNVDFMHCSSDNNSLDGIVLRDKKIALIDGTSPHIVDPINPGAVDSIIHLGDYWDEDGIRKNRDALISNNERIKSIFARVYNYLAAAGKCTTTCAASTSQLSSMRNYIKSQPKLSATNWRTEKSAQSRAISRNISPAQSRQAALRIT
jgi:hypothetical protein